MTDVDVVRLRAEAAARAGDRPVLPFAGTVEDTEITETEITEGSVARAARWYRPEQMRDRELTVVFLHGGYGLLGDLDLQDGYCRQISAALGVPVLAVEYRLAPEHRFDDSAADAVAAAAAAHAEGAARIVLWGDSAGGAVALRAARSAGVAALVLSNPNVDLTLAGLDPDAPGGPDAALSAWAFARWTVGAAPDLAADVAGLPPVFAAVGSADSLLPDSLRLVRACGQAGIDAQLLVIAGAAHGFMGDPGGPAVGSVLAAAARFLDLHR